MLGKESDILFLMINVVAKQKDMAECHVKGLKGVHADELTCTPVGSAPLLLDPTFTSHNQQGISEQEEVPAQRRFSRVTNKLAKDMSFLRKIHSCSAIPGARLACCFPLTNDFRGGDLVTL